MESTPLVQPPDLLKLLAHELRWSLLRLLAQTDLRVQELANCVNRPLNLVSYHLAQLRRGALVTERRSSDDARDVYYSLDLERLQTLYQAAATALHPALRPTTSAPLTLSGARQARVLFLCTHNSARSQMAEALLRQLGGAHVAAFSAGAVTTAVHPLALATLTDLGIDGAGLRSKQVDEFAGQHFDYVITVCDRMRERCPIFSGATQLHWSIADPASVSGDEAVQQQAFAETARQLAARLRNFLLVLSESAVTIGVHEGVHTEQ